MVTFGEILDVVDESIVLPPLLIERIVTAPQGMWRVVDTLGHPDDGRLHAIVNDFSDAYQALLAVDGARFPFTRTAFNDKGESLSGITPAFPPEVGPES